MLGIKNTIIKQNIIVINQKLIHVIYQVKVNNQNLVRLNFYLKILSHLLHVDYPLDHNILTKFVDEGRVL